ncbi:MAG: helix-turn-helix domain-containing protein [Polaromonas sp.]|nr:helix-turn-helix domain-containing protein [Polaromonas sp.]
MQELKTLIDKASKVCGSDKQLAERMGVHQQTISNLKKDRTITPETAAELAAIAGENPREAAIAAIIERAKGSRRGEVLKAILGKATMAAGVVTVLLLSGPDASAGRLPTFHDVYYVN